MPEPDFDTLAAEIEMWIRERHEAFIAGMRAAQPGFGFGVPISDEEEAVFQRYAAFRQPRLRKVKSLT